MNRLLPFAAAALLLLVLPASAHSGETDENGGHYVSSTGEYHYHHGYPAHQHEQGVCPYDFDDQTSSNSGAFVPTSNTTAPSQSSAYKQTYQEIDTLPYNTDDSGRHIIPNGGSETDNSLYLQYDFPSLGQVVHNYGLENQSRDFQEGATYGLNRGYVIADESYQYGFAEGSAQVGSIEPVHVDLEPDTQSSDAHIPESSDAPQPVWNIALSAAGIAFIGCILLFAITFLTANASNESQDQVYKILWGQFKYAAIVFGIAGAIYAVYADSRSTANDELRLNLYRGGYEDAVERAEEYLRNETGGEVYFEKDGEFCWTEINLRPILNQIDVDRAFEIK